MDNKVRIHNYGPHEVNENKNFNMQENGISAMWLELDADPQIDIIIGFDNYFLDSSRNGKIITATIPHGLLRSGKHNIKLIDAVSGAVLDSVIMTVVGSGSGSVPMEPGTLEKPNLFIVGAPRSATTSLYWTLKEHPEIYLSSPKEPFYFDKRAYDVLPEAIVTTEEYQSLFRYVPAGTRFYGEATTTYLSNEESLINIKHFSPHARIIAILRNPVHSALSLFLKSRESGVYEKSESFDASWAGEGKDRTFLNDYRQLFSIGDQLENLFGIFGKDQLKIILFDDLVIDPDKTLKEIYDFLGLVSGNIYKFRKGNCAQWGEFSKYVRDDTLNQMLEFFLPQIIRAEAFLQRDLSNWKKLDFQI